jgi:NitT/TauT family transport system substrate-binding protein
MVNRSALSRFVFPVVAALLLAVCGGTTGGTGGAGDGKFNGTIHIASSTWTGYAIIYVANAKGTWKSHGLDVTFQDVEDPNDRLIALTAGRLEGMASTVDAFARAQANGVPAVEVFPIDASVGGDGILAKNTIKSVQDLKGQKVAVNQGSVSEWFLAQVLKKNGLSLSDISEQNMKSGEAGAAFVAGQVDVAVTWEPWLSKAKARADGRVLVSSKEYPDLIMDSFAFRADFVDKYPGTVKEFMKAYYDAFAWFQQNTTEAVNIVGKATEEKPEDVKADLDTLTLFDLKTGKTIMGTKSSPGKIADNHKAAGDFWKTLGKIDTPAKPETAINPDLINSL